MVPLCLCWSHNQTKRQMVLPQVYSREEEEIEEFIFARFNIILCSNEGTLFIFQPIMQLYIMFFEELVLCCI